MREPMRTRQRTRKVLGAMLAALCALACGSAEHVQVPPMSEADGGADAGTETQVASAVNLCPHVDGSYVTPQTIAPHVSALVAVSASDPDSAVPDLSYAWHATSGAFRASDKAMTNYECSEIGTQLLTVVVTDHPGCNV